MPKRRRNTFSSRFVRVFKASRVLSPMFEETVASPGSLTCSSAIKSLSCESSSSPIGVSSEIGSLAIFSTLRTLYKGIPRSSDNSSAVGSRPSSCTFAREIRESLFIVSIMCTGIRIVRAWSAMARVID